MSETIKISNMYLNEADIDQSWEEEKSDMVYTANAAMKNSIISKAGESSQYLTCTTLSNGEVIVDIASDTPTETKAELSKIISDAKSNRDSSLEASYKSYRQGKIEEFNASTITVTKQFDEDAAEQSYKEQYANAKAAATQEFEDSLKDLSYSERKALKKAGFSYTVDDDGNITTSYTTSDNLSEYQKKKLQNAVQNASTAAAEAFQSYKEGLTNYVNDAKSDWTNTYSNANNNLTCEVSKEDVKKYWAENLQDSFDNACKNADKKAYETVLSSTNLSDRQKSAVSLTENGYLSIDKSKLTESEYSELSDELKDWTYEKSSIRQDYNEQLSVGLTKAASSGYYDSASNDVNSILNDPSTLHNDIAATTNTDSSISYEDPLADVSASLNDSTDIAVGEGSTPAAQMYVAWDPRLYKIDAFLFGKSESDTKTATGLGGLAQNAQIPFGSHTVNSAFYDYSWNIESVVKNSKYSKFSNQSTESGESTQKQQKTNSTEANIGSLSNKEMVSNVKDFQENSDLYGVASLMNTFTLTKLVGGLNVNIGSKKLENYMFDIRDQRRFYDSGVNGSKTEYLHASSNPTVSQLINWGNADKWGRTPYTYQDFVFSEWFGKIPNNRLITLRRYTSPTYDNLNFEDMYGAIESDGKYQPPTVEGTGTFAPVSTVVTYFGGDTGNALSTLMNFTTGTRWKDIESQVYDVNGDQGTDPQAKVDEMLERGGFGSAENDAVNGLMGVFGNVAGRVVSFGKMSMAMKQDVGIDDELMQRMYSAQNDPYEGVYKNRVLGPINRISSVQGRDAGIEFSQSFSIVCSYKSKAIGGINPKAALLDVLGNCLTMASPTAVFWGGGYRFNVTPHAYPFHDGGWRDSFMKKIYDGKILGTDGAIATMANGLKTMCADKDGNVSLESIGSNLTSFLGDGMSILGSAINSVTAMFGGSGSVGDLLTNAAGSMNSKTAEQNKQDSEKAVSELFNNINKMWHNKALKESTLPNLKTAGSILTGEPTGEWHLTIGNPLNPIMVIGNLICKQMEVTWDDELGPDDFPTGFKVTYTVEHAMARDNDGIQSMFNRGMGKFYVLPDYIQFSSDRMTHVDAFTRDNSSGDTGTYDFYDANQMKEVMQSGGVPTSGYNSRYVSPGSRPSNSGNYNTQLITKFTPLPSDSNTTLSSLRSGNYGTMRNSNLAVIASKSVNRKLV